MTWSKVHSSFWTGNTADSLGHDVDALHLAHYLVTGPMASNTGLYQFTLPIAVMQTGLSKERIDAAMSKLSDCGFVRWDRENQLVFVRNAVKWQIVGADSCTISKGDKRIPAVVRCVEKFSWHPFSGELASILAHFGVNIAKVHAIEEKHRMHAPSNALRDSSDDALDDKQCDHGRGMQEKESNSCQDHGRGMQKLPRLEREKEKEKEIYPARATPQPVGHSEASNAIAKVTGDSAPPIPGPPLAPESIDGTGTDLGPIQETKTLPRARERPRHVRLDQAAFLKQAYADGIKSVTGKSYSVSSRDMVTLDDAVDGHAPNISGKHFDWLRQTSEAFAKDVSEDAAWQKYSGGLSPKGFLAWLNEGRHLRETEKPAEHRRIVIEKPTMSEDEIRAAADKVLEALKDG